ncbi:flavodoxin domain-containing protein [Clostridium algoriphilum]|uniref:flavodoxin domain-containing protein n=1 Tax=Clostridium algoriphilum TaxID=198347 RepID=UPI001CF4269F|nr:flavodoxin domain-containing protein [Clostridium algoriphilum]MCB2293508.1 flavodoxin domain-containing protein [Clostridium algoriphilum]
MKTVVIYKSKTGFSKKYAEWIAEELSSDIFDVSKVNLNMLMTYDTIIYGAGLYAGGINGIKYIIQNLDKLKDKKIAIFATGASPFREEVLSEVRDKNFSPEEQKYIQFFYLRGGFNYSRLNPFNKVIMTLLQWKLKMKKELTPDERGMLASYDKPVDFTKKKNIDKLINYVNL